MDTIIDATPTQTKPYAGIGVATKKIIEQLVVDYPDDSYHLILHKNTETTLTESILKSKNVQVWETGDVLPGFLNPLNYPTRLSTTINQIFRAHPDSLYFATYFWNGHPAGNIPTAVMIYDFAMPFMNVYANKGGVINLLRKAEYWYWQNKTVKADAIIAISDSASSDYLKYYPNYPEEKVFRAYMGVELEKPLDPRSIGNDKGSETGSSIITDSTQDISLDKLGNYDHDSILATYLPPDWKEKRYLIYMGGNIQKTKNNEGVVWSYKEFLNILESKGIAKENAPYLVIAGGAYTSASPLVSDFKQLIKDLGISNKVVLSGFYEDSHKYALLSNAYAFTHLSHYEGFGLSVVEAMRAGTPVVISNTSSHPEVAGDAGLLVDGNDYKMVAEHYLKLFEDHIYAQELGKKGREYSRQFTWKACADNVHSALEFVHAKKS